MSGKFFLDTNIIIYSFDHSAPAKRQKARALIAEAMDSGNGVISFQVVQEFLNVALKKFSVPLSIHDARNYLTHILLPLCAVFPDSSFYSQTLDIKEKSDYSLYDCMIIQAAIESECKILYSEDLQNGHKISGLTIRNPF